MRHELKLALRRLRRRPGRGIATALTLALGTGALTAAFTAVDGVLLRPLPMEDQDALVVAWYLNPERAALEIPFRPQSYAVVAGGVASLSAVAGYPAWGAASAAVVQGVDGEYVLRQSLVADDFFGVLAARPALGRLLTASDDELGSAPVAVLSHRAWSSRFGRDPGVVGRTLPFRDGQTFTVVGVAPEGFDFPRGTDVWATLRGAFPDWGDAGLPGGGLRPAESFELHVVGRLAPGATPATVAADMTAAFREDPGDDWPYVDYDPVVTGLEEHLLGAIVVGAIDSKGIPMVKPQRARTSSIACGPGCCSRSGRS